MNVHCSVILQILALQLYIVPASTNCHAGQQSTHMMCHPSVHPHHHIRVQPLGGGLTGQAKVMLLPQHSVTSENTGLPLTVDSRFGLGFTICRIS